MTIQERLRFGASIARNRRINLDYAEIAEESADHIDALEAKLETATEAAATYRKAMMELTVMLNESRQAGDDAAMAHKVERDELMAKVDALTKDAERYRWLRECRNDSLVLHGDYQFCELMMEEVLDQAVDAAIAAEGKV